MAKNRMEEVAKLLGLELEEEFELKDMYGGRYKWTNGGLMSWSDTIQEWVYSLEFNNILAGNLEPNRFECIKLPYFEKGTMYKGMKLGFTYILKELGL